LPFRLGHLDDIAEHARLALWKLRPQHSKKPIDWIGILDLTDLQLINAAKQLPAVLALFLVSCIGVAKGPIKGATQSGIAVDGAAPHLGQSRLQARATCAQRRDRFRAEPVANRFDRRAECRY
jgi:hypothetical protein